MAEAGSVGRVAETAWIRHFSGLARPGPTDSRCRRCSSRSSIRTGALDDVALGCDPDDRFRIASITKPVTASAAVQLLDLDAHDRRLARRRARAASPLAHVRLRQRAAAIWRGFGDGDDALGAAVAELPGVRRLRRRRRGLLVRELGLLARGLADRAGRRHDLRGGGRSSTSCDPPACRARDFDEPSLAGTGAACGACALSAGAQAVGRPRLARRRRGRVRALAARQPVGRCAARASRAAGRRRASTASASRGERVGGVEVWGHGGSYGGFQSQLLSCPTRGAVFAGLTNSGRGKLALREIEDLWLERVLGARRPVRPTVELAARRARGLRGRLRERQSTASVERRRQRRSSSSSAAATSRSR